MQKKEEVAPSGVAEFGGKLPLEADAPEQQRRVALAEWIANPKNPLTARVLVNRIWHYHFGTGLVETPSDFGFNGARPTHPELLDWLADEFMAHGWRIKELQRLIVTSATYRQSGQPNAEALKIDAGSRLLWRFPPRRLEAEPLRDTMLAVSGKLDLQMGGPGFDLFEPNDNYVKVYVTKREYGAEEFRRMIYQNKPRVQLDDVFGAFAARLERSVRVRLAFGRRPRRKRARRGGADSRTWPARFLPRAFQRQRIHHHLLTTPQPHPPPP